MSNIGFKVSKPGEDVNTATDVLLGYGDELNSVRIAKKIHNNTASRVENNHDWGFVPSFLAFTDTGGGVFTTDLSAYTTSTKYSMAANSYIHLLGNTTFGATGFLEPPMRLFMISDEGKDVKTAKTEEMIFDLNLEMMQIENVFNMVINLPEETITVGNPVTRETTVNHNLDYVPIINPIGGAGKTGYTIDMNNEGRLLTYLGAVTMGMNPQTSGLLLVDDEKVYFRVTREVAIIDELFSAETASASVTVFRNRLDETFDHTIGYT